MAPKDYAGATVTCKLNNVDFIAEDTNERRFKEIDEKLSKIMETKNPVMYVFVNKGLKMNAGKVAAQVAHAQEELFADILDNGDNELRDFQFKCMKQNPRTVIILEAKDTDELYKINSYLESCNIWTGIYVDEGSADGDYMLEPTAIACQYLDKCDPRTETIFRMFKLYKHDDDIVPHLEKACSILEHVSFLACHPSKKKMFGDISNSKFRLDVLADAAGWDEYAYKNNLLKYIKPKD